MQITMNTLAQMSGKATNDNMRSVIDGLAMAGIGAGLNRPHRLAIYLAQLGHESEWFKYDREIWGPTAAQGRYDTRTDLGNTAARDGDGFLYRGRGPIQITGKYNYGRFTAWAQKLDARAPDFVASPDLVNTDPWEGLGPIWYWDAGNPTGESLNVYADEANHEMVTRRINGGLTGYADRLTRYTRAALVLLGFGPADIRAFQAKVFTGRDVDGIDGPKTRAALHRALLAQPLATFGDKADRPSADDILAAILSEIKALIERELEN